MKIAFISSGYSGIYPYLEKSIQNSLLELNHSSITITPEYNLENIEKMESFQPDFVLVFVGYKVTSALLQFLKKKGYTLGIWLTEDPFYIDESVSLCDAFHYIFTIDLGAYEYYQQIWKTKKIFHLPLGTDPSIYYPTTQGSYYYDLSIIGYPYPERVQLANDILENTSYTLILVGPLWRRYIKYQNQQRLAVINRWMEPYKVNQIYHLSRININSHRPFDFYKNKNELGIKNKSINNRTFDIAAGNSFQLLSAKPDTTLHFDVENDMISYSSIEECIHLIHQFIQQDQERMKFSKNAMKKVLHGHTFFHRTEKLINLIE